MPLVVLTDNDTHDAGEILTAALRAQRGVMLVGQATRGDVMVRRPVRISDGFVVRVAWGKVRLAGGGDYAGDGVLPDVPVEVREIMPPVDVSSANGVNGHPLTEKALQDRALVKRVGGDLVLRRATDILLGLKALGAFETETVAEGDAVLPEDK